MTMDDDKQKMIAARETWVGQNFSLSMTERANAARMGWVACQDYMLEHYDPFNTNLKAKPVQRWEYTTVRSTNWGSFHEQLTFFAEQGWRTVGFTTDGKYTYGLMEREVALCR